MIKNQKDVHSTNLLTYDDVDVDYDAAGDVVAGDVAVKMRRNSSVKMSNMYEVTKKI